MSYKDKSTFEKKDGMMMKEKAMCEKGIYVCEESRNKTTKTKFTGEMGSSVYPTDTASRK